MLRSLAINRHLPTRGVLLTSVNQFSAAEHNKLLMQAIDRSLLAVREENGGSFRKDRSL